MRIYIAGKITGDDRYKEKFAAVEKGLVEAGHVVLNPAALPEGLANYEDYMELGFAMINKCEAICLLPDWKDSPGAQREKAYAEATGKQVLFLQKVMDNAEGRKNKEVYEKVIHAFGADKQKIKSLEEMGELIAAIARDLLGEGERKNIIEETADVENMMEQMRIVYDASEEIEAEKGFKMERTIRKIQEREEVRRE